MLRKVVLCVLLLGLSFTYSFAQKKSKEDAVFTFPFHMDSRLLVFEGEMNGKPAKFAFDTGATLGLAGDTFVENGRIKVKNRNMTIRDSNNETKRVRTGTTKQMKFGDMKVSNPKALITNMPFLNCQDYYLLGSNVIKLVNWKIDFDKMEISVSMKPFPVEPEFAKVKVFYENNRPFTVLKFGGMKLSKVLIDTGYTRILDIDNSSDLMKEFIAKKEEQDRTNKNISLSVGAISESLDETTQIIVDSLDVAGMKIMDVPTDFFPTKSTKLGIGFFKYVSHTTIINNSESTYYLDLREEPDFKDPFLLNLQYDEGKILVSGKSLEDHPLYSQIELGDQVISINGNPTSSFTSECEFVTWYYSYDQDEMTIQTKDGEPITFTSTTLK